MAYSEKTYTGDGTTTDFAVTFDYLDQSHVKVSVNKVLTTTVGSDYKFTWNNSTNIRVDTVIDGNPVPTGLEIRLIRGTPIATPAVVFGGAASLSSENLNKNSEYLTFALQEATDANEEFTKLYLGAFASAPTVDNEGEALQVGAVYYDSVLSALYYWTGSTWIVGESTAAAGIFREAAEAARDAAIVAQDAAVVAQGAAEAAAGDAVSDAASAVAAALATAQGSADDAAGSASAAGTSASQASTSESNANDSATAAAASAASVDTVKLAGIETGAQVNRDLASQAEAEAGTDNTKVMTPLRVQQAIDANVGLPTPDVQTFTASGTWTKPEGFPLYTPVYGRMWSSGGAGGRQDSSDGWVAGGGGGGYIEFETTLRWLGDTQAVTVGAGATGRSNDGDGATGGSSAFSAVTLLGGSGGAQEKASSVAVATGGIGGSLSTPLDESKFHTILYEQGAQGGNATAGSTSTGGNATYAGAGGGSSKRESTDQTKAGGTSTFGGDGGDGGYGGVDPLRDGQDYAGGGGSSTTGTSGNGGDGFVEITVGVPA